MLFNCAECGFETANKEVFWCHIDNCHQQNHSIKCGVDATDEHKKVIPIKCTECEYQSNESREFRNHSINVHKNKRPFKCIKCDNCVSRYKACVCTHAKKNHDLNMCSFCDGIYEIEKDLDIHVNINHQKRVYIRCLFCKFQSDAANNSDQIPVTNPEEETQNAGDVKSKGRGHIQKCSQCSFKCNFVRGLIIHHRANHAKPTFACSLCIQTFSSEIFVENHIKKQHTIKTPKITPGKFKCLLCKFSSKKKNDLNHHYNTSHFVSKHFQCSTCEFSSKVLNELKKHIINEHKDSKTLPKNSQLFHFKCTICNLILSRKENLAKHLEDRHPDFNDELQNFEERKIYFVEIEEIPEPAFEVKTETVEEVKTETVEEVNLDSMNASEPLSKDPLSLNDSTNDDWP